jgi:hypothetical protein
LRRTITKLARQTKRRSVWRTLESRKSKVAQSLKRKKKMTKTKRMEKMPKAKKKRFFQIISH